MAAPPYGYGGGSNSYYNAMLGQMQQEDPYGNEDYVRQTPLMGRPPDAGAGGIANSLGSLAPEVAGQIASRAAPTGFGALAGAPGTGGFAAVAPGGGSPFGSLAGVGKMGAGTAAGVGIATELIGGALKPKAQQATASPFADLTDQYGRREEGSGDGIAGGAVKWGGRGAQVGNVVPGIGTAVGAGIGAIGGAIGGAFTKNAASAYSDFSREDAVNAIRNMYQTRGGREVTPAELNQILIGAGTKPGDKWVGEKGLYSVLQSLDKNFAAERTADPTAQAAQAYAKASGLPNPMVPPAAGAPAVPGAAPTDRVTTPEAAAGMNQNPQSVDAPSGLPGAPLGRPSPDATYGGQANSTLPSAPPAGAPPAAAGAPPAGAPPATTPPAGSEKWDTDGYAKPAYIAAKPSKTAPPGWNNEKWNDPNHQTPKYVVGRILSQFEPRTTNVEAAVAELNKAFPGTRRVSNGDVNIPGLGTIDILQAADVGGKAWHFGTGGGKKGGGKGPDKVSGGAANMGSVLGQFGLNDPGRISEIIKRIQGISGGGQTLSRDALLNQL